MILALLLFVWGGAPGAASASAFSQAVSAASAETKPAIIVQDFTDELSGVRAANPDVHVRIDRDRSVPGERVLLVDYPPPTTDPAGRDVQCAARNQDWTGGRAISFQIKPEHAIRLSVSFVDRNGVVYSARVDLQGAVWQRVRIPFDDVRPNPFFQPPGAKTGAPLDVSDVKFIAFAPQDKTSGQLAIGRFVVSK